MDDFVSDNFFHLRYFGWFIIFSFFFLLVELFSNFRKRKIMFSTLLIDFFYLFFNYFTTNFVITLGMLLHPFIKEYLVFFSWLSDLPFIIQVLISLLLIDMNGYVVHRFMHSNRLTWPFHAIHHSSPNLYWIAAERSHPLNSIFGIFLTFSIFDSFLTSYALVIASIISLGYSYFIHSGYPIHYHSFNKFFISPLHHQIHHSKNSMHYDKNFAGMFSFLDVIFGTYFFDKSLTKIEVGVRSIPESLSKQLLHPFK